MRAWRKNLLKTWLIPEQKLRDAMELYPGKLRNEVKELLWKELVKKLIPGIGLAVLLLIMSVFIKKEPTEESGRVRPKPGAATVSEEVQLVLEQGIKEITLPIFAREYEEAELEVLAQAAERFLEEVVPKNNFSFENVTTHLYFPMQLPKELGGGEISWSTDAPELVSTDGTVFNEELLEAESVEIMAKLTFGSEYRYFSRVLTVYPMVYSEEEAIQRAVEKELLKQEQESRTKEEFLLPEIVLGHPVQWKKKEQMEAGAFFVLVAVLVPVYMYANYFSNLDKQRKHRKEQAENCYTEFITKLSLMLAAGVSVRQAFYRLAEEYEGRYGTEHALSGVLVVTRQELENGGSESELYEAFGRRIGVLAYQRMASLLTQNVSKGVQGLRMLLLQEAKEVMAQERANIKVKGEQAGTKLLFPMMGLLFLVFAVLLVPAFQSF